MNLPGPDEWIIAGVAIGLAALICGLLTSQLKARNGWMIACLLSGGLYVAVSLRLEMLGVRTPLLGDTLSQGLRWSLLLTALYSFYRFRLRRS